jgi:formylglycine-generating enzyme required for sulfatase activity
MYEYGGPMAEIFISYKNERRRAAEHLAAVLSYHGHSVWYDYRLIKGNDFGVQLGRRIREAKAVVVLWCSLSAGSRWVIEEADLAESLGTLIPVKIEACELPAGFQRQSCIDLSSWDGSPSNQNHQLDPLIKAVKQRAGRSKQLNQKGLEEYESTWRLFGAPSLKAFALETPLDPVESEGRLPDAATASGPAQAPSVATAPATPRTHELASEAAHARRAEERKFRAEGRIPVLVGDIERSQIQWLLPGAGEPFRDIGGGPEMVVVPAGTFMMGSPNAEPERHRYEIPEHKVRIARPFAVGRHAVTRGQFAAFALAMGLKTDGAFKWMNKLGEFERYQGISWRDPGFPQDDSHPVTCVTWDEASAYASWLAAATGKPYRLLTEAEWEYAARAGADTPFWWGSSITTAQANYDGNFVYGPDGTAGAFREATVPVDSFAANPWGLYNVHGNVWEWCEDAWHRGYIGAPRDGSAWLRGGDNGRRVVRGGSWFIFPRFVRSAQRFRIIAGFRYFDLGFRLARPVAG